MTDLEGKTVIDYWDLPMENPEGIAINNDLDPPVMYIVTDPSSPHGKQYISAFFAFEKPVAGTGLRYYDKHAPPPPPVECEGCDEVWEMVDEISEAFISSIPTGVSVQKAVLSSVLPFVGLAIILFVLFIFVATIIIRRRMRSSNRNDKDKEDFDEENLISSNTSEVDDSFDSSEDFDGVNSC